MTVEHLTDTQRIIEQHDQYMVLNYPRHAVAMVRGEGCRLWDADGREYLDLFAGFGGPILGHCHLDLVKAVSDQAGKLWHVGNLLHTEPQVRAARAIAEQGFGGRSFFCHSGADANEAALKLARLYGKANPGPQGPRFGVIATHLSFHGRSFATICATGQAKVREGFEPLLEGFKHVPYNDLDAMRRAIDDRTVAILVEPIQGEGGVNVPDDAYLPGLRALCDEHDLLLICDEVWTGCGRTGRAFAHQHWGITPDIMTLGKGVGGGLAVGVMCATPRVAELYNTATQGAVRHATTLGGNCLAMAAAATVFEVIARDRLLEHATRMGEIITRRARQWQASNIPIREVRGKGLFIGIQFDLDQAWFDHVSELVKTCLAQGLLIGSAQQDVVRIAPALTIPEADLTRGLDQLESILREGA